jgi:tRNA U34 5-methylaminomethyl-2-thiouridine-forming methyltransferase MnmC
MKRSLVLTKDGTHTVYCEIAGETFHSMHGSLQESEHVFIRNGMRYATGVFAELHILEVGFGTGLNALLTLRDAQVLRVPVSYTAVEAYPLSKELVGALNYPQFTDSRFTGDFLRMHHADSCMVVKFESMKFTRHDTDIRTMELPGNLFNLVYFDAFSAARQPWMWEATLFEKLHHAMTMGGILVTYASRSSARRALAAAGLVVEKLPGARGKLEMMRATKMKIF